LPVAKSIKDMIISAPASIKSIVVKVFDMGLILIIFAPNISVIN